MNTLANKLKACYTGAVFDVLRARGLKDCTLPSSIIPLQPGTKLAGPAFPMLGRPDDHIDDHESLLLWTEFLSMAPQDHVVVCQPQDDGRAHMGELSAETLQFRGVAGFVVDGGCRDVAFIRKMGFPVFCRYTMPRDVVGSWIPETFNQPVTVGGTIVRAGDYVLGDDDGVVVIPAGIAAEVIGEVEAIMQTENLVRKAILDGVDPKDAYLKYGKF